MPRVVHFEIQAENPERAVEFYGRLFDWKFQKWDGPMPYWLIMTGDPSTPGINGGLLPRNGLTPTDGQSTNCFVCTVDVPNIDEYTTKATSTGGKNIVPKMPVPGVGWLAYFKDTEGNIFGMMQSDPNAK